MAASRTTSIVWFRQDLRLDDHPALRAAAAAGEAVIPVYLWPPGEKNPWSPGAASRWWLHQSLTALDKSLRRAGSRLIVRRGGAAVLEELIRETGARKVFWNQRYEPAAREQDARAARIIETAGAEAALFPASLLFAPEEIQTQSGRPFQVFTPFWKACLSKGEPARPVAAPRSIPAPWKWPGSLTIEDLELEPKIDWAGGIRETWTPGEEGARKQLRRFLQQTVTQYQTSRELPAVEGTSRLSPHLHFGEISARRAWHEVRRTQARHASSGKSNWKAGPESYLRELCWREFAHHLLHHFPHTTEKPLRERFAGFPWRKSKKDLKAWQTGQTGYPIVDAGMRELWATGWIHNRVRMVVGSFLVKDLRLSWLEGARWFWDTLVDADLANNTLGWQWVAGCGADAAPYFRVFNPVSQGEKFDPAGDYVRRWVPEIANLPDKWIHKPWEAPPMELQKAGVELGKAYPEPMVDHAAARRRALDAFESLRGR